MNDVLLRTEYRLMMPFPGFMLDFGADFLKIRVQRQVKVKRRKLLPPSKGPWTLELILEFYLTVIEYGIWMKRCYLSVW